MLILINDKTILTKDAEGKIKCDDLESSFLSTTQTGSFVSKQAYENTIQTIANKLEKSQVSEENNILIFSLDYYRKPGFEEAITEYFGDKILIKSDVELALQNLSSGEYLFVNSSKDCITSCEVSINRDAYSLSDIAIQNNNELNLGLLDAFREHMLPGVDKQDLLEVLYDYSNIIALNKFLTDGKYAIMGNENIYEDINLYFKGSLFQATFSKDLTLSDFFSAISNLISKLIDGLEKGRELILQSPLLDYLKVADMINPHDNLYLVNKLRQLESVESLSFVHKKLHQDIEIDLYPVKQKAPLPFKSWILAEVDNLSLSFSINDSVLSVDLSAIKEFLTDTIFSIGNRELLKYHVFINTDGIGNIYSRITDLNGKQYCKLLNN